MKVLADDSTKKVRRIENPASLEEQGTPQPGACHKQ